MKLYNYQERTIDHLRKAMTKFLRVFLCMPTGAGKTTVGSWLVEKYVSAGKRVLILAHRDFICYQFRDRLNLFGVFPGMIMSKEKAHPSRLCQIAMRQTLVNRKLPKVDLVIIDEAHLCKGPQYQKIIDHYTALGVRILYLSATPERVDRKPLNDIADTLIAPVKMIELIKLGRLGS
jgi:superfamily II DNA or RNA helicase